MGSLGRIVSAVLLAAGIAAPAWAAYPDRPVHIIVPAPAGGTTDILARILGQRLGEIWGQSVIVEDKPGGLGVIATDAVAKAAPDGYTLGLFASNHAINPIVIKLPYDAFKDFAAVHIVATVPGLLVVNKAQITAPDLAGAVAEARANPGKYNYASPLPLTAGHRSMELLKHEAKIDIQHIPYNGGPPAVNDLLAGHVQFLVIAIPTVAPYVAAGRLRALAVTSPQRFEGLPDVPTVAESGYPGFDSVEWYGLFTRAGVPPAVIQKVSADVQLVLARPDIRKQFLAFGAIPGTGGPAEMQGLFQAEYDRWHKLAGEVDLRAD